jgi:hypothetical protein
MDTDIPINVLFLNHKKSQCGVYNYGTRLFDIWKKSSNINFIYKEVGSLQEYGSIKFSDFKIILYNYHLSTMCWLNRNNITKKSINVAITHECDASLFDTLLFDYCIDTADDIPRPIFEQLPSTVVSNKSDILEFLNYGINDNIPIIGSFGFGFAAKGFDKIINYVNQQFDNAIIKIIMPFADYGDKLGENAKYVTNLCSLANKKPNIKLLITHKFLDDSDILYFLNSNTINIFLYDLMIGRGISSTIDFALSVNKPLGISDSYMFRHIYNDEICVYKQEINHIINNGTKYISQFKEKYSHKNSINFIDTFINSLLKDTSLLDRLTGRTQSLKLNYYNKNELFLSMTEADILDRQCIYEITQDNAITTNEDKFNGLKNKYIVYYKLLYFINLSIWELENKIKQNTISSNDYTKYAKLIFEYNQSRTRIKNIINILTNKQVNNQNNITKNEIQINIINENEDNIKTIIYCLLKYDMVKVNICNNVSTRFIFRIKTLFPTIKYFEESFNNSFEINFRASFASLLSKFIDDNLYNILNPIFYKGDGKLGDFILQLSVINENYINTGRKGILYLDNNILLSCSLEKTYIDSFSLIIQQEYIQDYKIYNKEYYDIDLSSWRNNYLLYHTTWYHIFKTEYGTEWGKHPWISVKKNNTYQDKVIVAFTPDTSLDIKSVLSQYDINDVYLIGYTESNKQEFAEKFGYDLPFIYCKTVEDMAVVVNSCKLFIGTMSSPLTLAQGLHHNTIAILHRNGGACHNQLDRYFPNYKSII